MIKKTLRLLLLLSMCSFSFGDEPIIVYGGLYTKSEYDDSNSLSVRTVEDFENYNATHLEELANSIPNLNFATGGQRARYFQIRGIGERSSYEGMPNHSVGVVIDDIDYSGIGGVSNLLGVEQVEVFKGPQSTKLGPSAMAGMIHIKTFEPTQRSRKNIHLSAANFSTFEEAANLSGSISEDHQFSLSATKRDSDGYIENTYLNKDDTHGQDEFSLRTKIQSNFNKIQTKLTLHFFEFNNGYDIFNQDNDYTTFSDKPGRDDQQTFAQALRIEARPNSNVDSVTILTHHKTKTLYSYDEDWGNNEFWNSLAGYNSNYNYDIAFVRSREDFTLDQRFLTKDEMVLGLYLKNSKESFKEIGFKDDAQRKNITGDFDTNNYALYFENKNDLNSLSWFNYGVRGEVRKAIYQDSSDNKFSPSEFLYAAHMSFNVNSKTKGTERLSYIKLSKGYKAGGFNTQDEVPSYLKEFDAESLYSLELGQKSYYDTLQASINYAVFYMYRDDVQVKSSFQDDPMDPSSYTFYNTNATSGHNYGVEVETIWSPLDKLEVVANLGLLETKYGQYELEGNNLKGREMPHAPQYQFSMQTNIKLSDNLSAHISHYMSDNFYYSNSHSEKESSYDVTDIKLKYVFDKYNISLWSKNIFDEKYSKRGFFFSNMPPAWNEEKYVQLASPRTYGVTLKAEF